ncbi:winged helix-turn-helix domain-containing protein [Skermania piniformis]|uniref:Winged helix-turn-helix domain-containing protein n=1 Tax=Skermania pinensis TaxID=39122 RepID=A0ABX8SE23_9ACTN|nr:winged helix-turn-helix domain-containing protein [Skermania piniformis]QXQ14870.1 winged helix-turn-helix domain-containing protein [Skermania piniformis]
MDPSPEPIERFAWERVVRRVRMPKAHKYLGLVLATYADADGSSIRPGVDRLARVTDTSTATVKRGLAWLREAGFVERTRQGNRWAKSADEYRLTVPPDVLDMDILSVDED